MTWSVYIILCEDNSLYTGCTTNVELRFERHKLGLGAKYTRSHKPLKIVYTEEVADKSAALKREKQIQSWSRKKKMEFLEHC